MSSKTSRVLKKGTGIFIDHYFLPKRYASMKEGFFTNLGLKEGIAVTADSYLSFPN
jgi:hypothetical protein